MTPVMIPDRVGLEVSRRAFERLCRANPDLRLGRDARGALWITAPADSDTGMRNASLTAQLWNWNRARGLGVAFDSSGGFTLPNGVIHAPDASWVARERWEALDMERRAKFAPICPDFVAELRSPSGSLSNLRERILEFANQGTRLAWLLDTESKSVEIYRQGGVMARLERPAALSGEEVLPGFILDLRGILYD